MKHFHHAVTEDVKDDKWLCTKQLSVAQKAERPVSQSAAATQSEDTDEAYGLEGSCQGTHVAIAD